MNKTKELLTSFEQQKPNIPKVIEDEKQHKTLDLRWFESTLTSTKRNELNSNSKIKNQQTYTRNLNIMEILGVHISHGNKCLYPDAGITKEAVAEYYQKVADYLIPFIKNRPITLKRYPDGVDNEGFFNKHVPDYFPSYLPHYTVPMEHDKAKLDMVGVETAKDLVYLASQNTLELHMPLSTVRDLKKPDQIIFDFDPSDDDFEKVRQAALGLKDLLNSRDVRLFAP